MNKKRYEAPAVKRVRLVVTNSILAVCHSSPNLTPRSQQGGASCAIAIACYNPPT